MDEQEQQAQRPTFPKREHIVSRTLMEQLFSKGNGHSAVAFPLRIVYMQKERVSDDVPVQVLISVSKRHFKRAVLRNRVKRQIREAYRLQKHILIERIPEGRMLAVAFIWLADELQDSRLVAKSVEKLLGKVAGQL